MKVMGPVRLVLSLSCALVASCAFTGANLEDEVSFRACVQPQSGEFVAAARYWPNTAWPERFGNGIYGDLVVTDAAVRFVKCDVEEAGPRFVDHPHSKTELVYRDGDWLFLRSLPKEDGSRDYTGFELKGMAWARAATFAKKALAEIRQRREKLGLIVNLPMGKATNLAIVSAGVPELNLASIDRSKIAEGAAADVAVAVVQILGGIVGIRPMGKSERKQAAENQWYYMTLDETLRRRLAVLANTLSDMRIGPRLAEQIGAHLRRESTPGAHVAVAENLECGKRYRDCALRGIAGVVEIGSPFVRLQADQAELKHDTQQAQQELMLYFSVRVFSTVSGQPVSMVKISERYEQHSLAEWVADNGARFRAVLEKAIEPLPNTIAMELQGALDKLCSIE